MKLIFIFPLVALSLPITSDDSDSISGLEPAAYILTAMKAGPPISDSISGLEPAAYILTAMKADPPISTDWNINLRTYLEIIDLRQELSHYLERGIIKPIQERYITADFLQARLGDNLFSAPLLHENVIPYAVWSAWKSRLGVPKAAAYQHYRASILYLQRKTKNEIDLVVR
jgi:hypothetical protein